MHYIVDGYNLLFRLRGKRNNLDSLRRDFIQEMDQKAELLKLDMTIVFDGHFSEGAKTRTHYRNLEIIYSPHGESADELILAELASSLDVRHEVIVTSDRDLAYRAKKLHAKTERAEDFYRTLQERYQKRSKKKVAQKGVKKASSPPVATEGKEDPETVEHYQKIFEERLKEEEKKEKPRSKKKKSRGAEEVDDYKRWLEIFERKVDEKE